MPQAQVIYLGMLNKGKLQHKNSLRPDKQQSNKPVFGLAGTTMTFQETLPSCERRAGLPLTPIEGREAQQPVFLEVCKSV